MTSVLPVPRHSRLPQRRKRRPDRTAVRSSFTLLYTPIMSRVRLPYDFLRPTKSLRAANSESINSSSTSEPM